MSASPPKPGTESITPAVHLEFIQNQLENRSPSAPAEIEEYHRALFLHHHSVEWEKYRQEAKTHQDHLAYLEGQLKSTDLELSKRTKHVAVDFEGREDTKPAAPWNTWDIGMFATCLLGIAGLITFGVLNISFNLLESGFITFQENPIRAYFWAALLPVGALAVKVGWDVLKDTARKERYLWSCLGLGIIGVLVWVGAYACVYPTLSRSVDEQIASLTVTDNPASNGAAGKGLNFAGAKWVDAVTVSGQAVAEIFLSAVLGIYLTQLYSRHRPVRLALDPTFRQLEEERHKLHETVARERLGLAEASGNLVRLENQLTALIAYGKSMFHRESAKRTGESERRQVILDQLSEHLRNHLDADPPNRLTSVTAPTATQATRNGD